MAQNRIYAGIETENRTLTVPTNTAPGTPLIISGKPYVTLTGSGDYVTTRSIVAGDTTTTVTKQKTGGIGPLALKATCTPSGTFSFPVTGATITAAYEADGTGKKVYITPGGVLTLTSAGNTAFGVVDFFRGEDSATDTAVKIGVTL